MRLYVAYGGGRGIRTPGRLAPTTVFKTVAINHSAIPPQVFLARDRLGIKPLYHAVSDGVFLFASEIKALLASGLVSRQVDREAVWGYLALGSIPQPSTIIADAEPPDTAAQVIPPPARRPNTAAPTPQRYHFLLGAGREGPGALAGNPPSAGASYIVFIPVSVGLGSWTSPGSPCTAPVSAPRVRCRGAWQYR